MTTQLVSATLAGMSEFDDIIEPWLDEEITKGAGQWWIFAGWLARGWHPRDERWFYERMVTRGRALEREHNALALTEELEQHPQRWSATGSASGAVQVRRHLAGQH